MAKENKKRLETIRKSLIDRRRNLAIGFESAHAPDEIVEKIAVLQGHIQALDDAIKDEDELEAGYTLDEMKETWK